MREGGCGHSFGVSFVSGVVRKRKQTPSALHEYYGSVETCSLGLMEVVWSRQEMQSMTESIPFSCMLVIFLCREPLLEVSSTQARGSSTDTTGLLALSSKWLPCHRSVSHGVKA